MNTTLITGLPRSGTNLLCVLLDDLPDTLALAEPMDVPPEPQVEPMVREVDRFVADIRKCILEGRAIPALLVRGAAVDNWAEPPRMDGAIRNLLPMSQQLYMPSKKLSGNFHLFIKHPFFFSALADRLQDRYDLLVTVRHPLAVLASWQTLDMAIRLGRAPVAESLRPELKQVLDAIHDPLLRQVKLIETLLTWYSKLSKATIIRFEDLQSDPLGTLRRIHAGAVHVRHPISQESMESRYVGVDLTRLARALATIESTVVPFYPDFMRSLRPYL